MGTTQRSKATNKYTKKRRTILTVAIIAALVVAGFGVWEWGRHDRRWGTPDELRAIKAQSLAKNELPGFTQSNIVISGMGNPVGVAPSPSITRTFDIGSRTIEEAQTEIIKIAEKDGWVHDPSLEVGGEWWGRKKVSSFDLAIIIKKDPTSSNRINIEVF